MKERNKFLLIAAGFLAAYSSRLARSVYKTPYWKPSTCFRIMPASMCYCVLCRHFS